MEGAASRGKACPRQQSSQASHSALLVAGQSWSWPQKKPLHPFATSFPTPRPLSDLAPCRIELSKSLLLSCLQSHLSPSSPMLTLVVLFCTVSPRHANHQGAHFHRCQPSSPAQSQASSGLAYLSGAYRLLLVLNCTIRKFSYFLCLYAIISEKALSTYYSTAP